MPKTTHALVLLGASAILAWIAIAPAGVPQASKPIRAQAATKKATSAPPSDAAQLNNLGVAYMNRQQFEQALRLFERAYTLDSKLYAARLNQGIALLNLQRYEPARKILLEATEREPQNPRTWYNLGLLERATSNTHDAIAAFQRVAALDPKDPDAEYFLGLLHSQMQQYDKAVAAFEHALALNPFHVSAEFGLAQAEQRAGKSDLAKEHLARFQHLTQEKLGVPMSPVYGEQGKYSRAEQVTPALAPVPPRIPVHFVDMSEAAGLPTHAVPADEGQRHMISSSFGTGACIFDYDGDGRADILLVDANGNTQPALFHNLGNGRFEDVT